MNTWKTPVKYGTLGGIFIDFFREYCYDAFMVDSCTFVRITVDFSVITFAFTDRCTHRHTV